jgi:hypothetical protein
LLRAGFKNGCNVAVVGAATPDWNRKSWHEFAQFAVFAAKFRWVADEEWRVGSACVSLSTCTSLPAT